MNIKSTRKEKLRNYSVLAGTLAAATAANGQIIYTDVTPDQTITTGNTYMLDMNNDAVDEITIGVQSISVSSLSFVGVAVGLTTMNNNAAVVAHTASSLPINYVDALGFGTVIDNTQNFMSAAGSTSTDVLIMAVSGLAQGIIPISAGEWLGVSNMYIGVKFDITSNTHYGWARLDVAANASSFVIKDYAYNATANTAIFAGDNASSVNDLDIRDQMDMMIVDGQLVINLLNADLSNGLVSVTNMNGQQVSSFTMNSTNAKFDLSTLATGVYAITVVFDQGVASEKLFIR